MRIHEEPDPSPGQTLKSQKVKFLHEKYTGTDSTVICQNIPIWVCTFLKRRKPSFFLLILVNFNAPGSGSAYPIRIRNSQIDADLEH